MSKDTDASTLPPHYRWNFVAFLVDFASFGVAFAFVNLTSVLPAFVRQLTDSAPLVGLINTVFQGGWLLPQLAVARLINDKPRKKPYLLAGLSGRIVWWALTLALWTGLARHSTAMLTLFFVGLGLWAVTDGITSVAWFDILARAIPPKRRSRLIGTGQFISGLAGIGVGALVGLILERHPFPYDYALLFTLASVGFIASTVGAASIREPPPEEEGPQADEQMKGNWLRILVADPAFRHLMACRMLIGMIGLASPFYVGYASAVLRLPERTIGGFVVAQTVAGMVASIVLSLISERWGPRRVICVGSAFAAIGPAFALAVHLAGGDRLAPAYPIVYASLGVANCIWMLGFFNHMLEIAPDNMRPAYVGMGNTIMGLLTLTPMAGGWLLEKTSYTTLFGVTGAFVATGFVLTLGLKPSQQLTQDPH